MLLLIGSCKPYTNDYIGHITYMYGSDPKKQNLSAQGASAFSFLCLHNSFLLQQTSIFRVVALPFISPNRLHIVNKIC